MSLGKVAINGMGRIGRATFKIILETRGLELVAVNDLAPIADLAYLLKYDTIYRSYKDVRAENDTLRVGNGHCVVLNQPDLALLPWSDLGVDLVFECTGIFTKRLDLKKHLHSGAKRVILSAPSKSEEILTVVHGVNKPDSDCDVISCASCTTNCITPMVEIMMRRIGIRKALMTTVHAYTASQNLVDGRNKSLRRGRAGACNLVPTSTGAALATAKALPECAGKFDGIAIRAPVPVGSIADVTFLAVRPTTVAEINTIFKEEASSERYAGVLGVTQDPIVSADIIQDSRAALVDISMTKVVDGDLVKILGWYDNEWGYASQMVREAVRILGDGIPTPAAGPFVA